MTLLRTHSRFRFSDCRDLFGNINSHRAPRDASSTTNTTGCSKLIYPSRKFMDHPLAVAGLWRCTNRSTMNVGKIHREARVPLLPAFRMFTFQIGNIFHGCAEAGRADHGAICACEATCSDVVPPRVLVVSVEQLLDIYGFYFPAHLLGGSFEDSLCRLLFRLSRRAMRKFLQNISAKF